LLTDREYLRDKLDYDNSVAHKGWWVRFINTCCSFYYIAFLMNIWGDKPPEGLPNAWCYLTYQMKLTFGLYIACSFCDLIGPVWSLHRSIRRQQETLRLADAADASQSLKSSFIEIQSQMNVYDGASIVEDLNEVLLPLVIVVSFGTALPVAAVIAFVYFGMQLRIDAWKLLNVMGRPFPRFFHLSQWVWFQIVETVMHVAAVTNIGLLCFVIPSPLNPPGSTTGDQYSMFLTLFSIFAMCVLFANQRFPADSASMKLALRRRDYQKKKLKYFMDHGNEVTPDALLENGNGIVIQARGDFSLDDIGVIGPENPGFQEAPNNDPLKWFTYV